MSLSQRVVWMVIVWIVFFKPRSTKQNTMFLRFLSLLYKPHRLHTHKHSISFSVFASHTSLTQIYVWDLGSSLPADFHCLSRENIHAYFNANFHLCANPFFKCSSSHSCSQCCGECVLHPTGVLINCCTLQEQ